jgi:hypothetical protein
MSTLARSPHALCLWLCLGCSARQPLPTLALRAVSVMHDRVSAADPARSWDLALIAELSFQPGMRSARTLRAELTQRSQLAERCSADEPCAVASLCAWEEAATTEALALWNDGVSP